MKKKETRPFDKRLVKCLDGLYVSFKILNLNYSTLYETCCEIIKGRKHLSVALSQSWTYIDALHRIREISQTVPGLSGKNIHLVNFLRKTKLAEDYRDYIQHLREHLSEPSLALPIWGSLSWVDPDDPMQAYIVIYGSVDDNATFNSCRYNEDKGRWLSKVTLGFDNSAFDFDPMHEAASKFHDFIIPWIFDRCGKNLTVVDKIRLIPVRVEPDEDSAD